jgi:hypothetical protein
VCTYNRRALCRRENCVERPQGVLGSCYNRCHISRLGTWKEVPKRGAISTGTHRARK